MGIVRDATSAALLDAARALGPQIRACADQIEQDGRLPEPLVEAIADAGLFKMTVPQELGGGEVAPETYARVIEEIARADGSTGWCVMLPATCAIAAGTLSEAVAWEIWGRDPRAYVAGSGAGPGGRAVAVEGGYRVNGRWPFTSGCRHATWLMGRCIVHDGKAPRLGPDGRPEARLAFFPIADCQIIDTWQVTGLRGSGSHDFTVTDVFLPAERTVLSSTFQPPRHAGPLYAYGAGKVPVNSTTGTAHSPWAGATSIGFAAVSLGIARGALDAFTELAASKAPRGGKALLRDDPVVQSQVGQAEASLRAARALIYETVREVWETVSQTGASTAEHQLVLRLAGAHAAALSAQVVETVWKAAGASSIFLSSPLERRFRDVHVATQNIAVSPVLYGIAGRLFLGVDG